MLVHKQPTLVSVERHFEDDRGYFTRLFDNDEHPSTVQINVALSHLRGTLRGLHYLDGVQGETKSIRVLSGSIFDVAVDLRPESPTRGKYFTFELSSPDKELIIPPFFAHGYQTLEPNTSISYRVDTRYNQELERGVNALSRDLNIQWPLEIAAISDRDRLLPEFSIV
jgi:dTDP-4-dehydrorhamnose 3,5-epimerase